MTPPLKNPGYAHALRQADIKVRATASTQLQTEVDGLKDKIEEQQHKLEAQANIIAQLHQFLAKEQQPQGPPGEGGNVGSLERERTLEGTMAQIQSKTRIYPAFGKREEGVPKGPRGCLGNHLQGPKVNDNVVRSGDGRMTVLPDQKSRLHGLFVIGFIGHSQCKPVWLVDTGAMRNILSYECYKRLPESLKFPLHEDGSQVFVADGRKTSTYGSGRLSVKSQDVNISVGSRH